MTGCEFADVPDVELYFYGELEDADRRRVEAHLGRCGACRQQLDDLHAIRRALADRPVIDAPATGDWSGFMRRLDVACSTSNTPRSFVPSVDSATRRWVRLLAAAAAIVAFATLGVELARRTHEGTPASTRVARVENVGRPTPAQGAAAADSSLREATAEHLERSKLVVLGLTALDPKQTPAADWQYERQLAGSLLDDTRLYRQAAQQRGMTDVARVMRDLETVLIETSMSDSSDREALARVQRLIAKRDLVVKMQLVGTN
jgi:hypothetical protein